MQNGLRRNFRRPTPPWYLERHPEDQSLCMKMRLSIHNNDFICTALDVDEHRKVAAAGWERQNYTGKLPSHCWRLLDYECVVSSSLCEMWNWMKNETFTVDWSAQSDVKSHCIQQVAYSLSWYYDVWKYFLLLISGTCWEQPVDANVNSIKKQSRTKESKKLFVDKKKWNWQQPSSLSGVAQRNEIKDFPRFSDRFVVVDCDSILSSQARNGVVTVWSKKKTCRDSISFSLHGKKNYIQSLLTLAAVYFVHWAGCHDK